MSRISIDEYFTTIADNVKNRGTCVRAQVGCVLVDKRGQISSTGYNGPPSTISNCTLENPCHPSAVDDSCNSFTKCGAVHAEQNALLQCKDIYNIETCYVTWSPCWPCTKLLLNTSCKKIVFINEYHSSDLAKERWIKAGRIWEKYDRP